MSYPLTQIGGKAFNHSAGGDAEAEYDRLRDLARQEASKRNACYDKAHQAYERGDGAEAHNLSQEGKKHAAKMEEYNKQASEFIFRENNTQGRVDSDTIDLHGQHVEEAEQILEDRIRYAQQTGQTHLHVIVGKGNHSVNHVQKIKPRVEQVCQELGLQYATEENAGRIYINLQGGPAVMPQGQSHHGGNQHQQQHQQPYQQHQQPQYGQQQQNQNQNQEDEMAQLAGKIVPKLLKQCCGCVIM